MKKSPQFDCTHNNYYCNNELHPLINFFIKDYSVHKKLLLYAHMQNNPCMNIPFIIEERKVSYTASCECADFFSIDKTRFYMLFSLLHRKSDMLMIHTIKQKRFPVFFYHTHFISL